MTSGLVIGRTYSLVVHGAPRTKKNSNVLARAGRRHLVLPSAAWVRWVRGAAIMTDVPLFQPLTDAPVNCRALFYRDALRGDAVGFMQGLADLLEKRGVIVNDSQIVQWDGTRLLVDRERPRVEVELTVLGGQ